MYFSFVTAAVLTARVAQTAMRLSYAVRAYLIQRLYLHSVSLGLATLHPPSDTDSSRAAVLISVDTRNIQAGVEVIFECLTGFVVVGVGSYMLFRLIGLAFIGPLLLACACTAFPFLLGGKLQAAQRATLGATESRIERTDYLIRNARGVRLENMENTLAESILAARENEIRQTAMFRKLDVAILLVGTCSRFSLTH